jgi:hypothetical protein
MAQWLIIVSWVAVIDVAHPEGRLRSVAKTRSFSQRSSTSAMKPLAHSPPSITFNLSALKNPSSAASITLAERAAITAALAKVSQT